jgi:hypothetical protein
VEAGATDSCAVKESPRYRTSTSQMIPADFQEKLHNFKRHVIQLNKKQNYTLQHTEHADETEVYFDMPRNYTVDAKGAKEVKIRSTGYERQHVTVMLYLTADLHKLFSIAKRCLRMRCSLKLLYVHRKNGRKSADLMEDWVRNVWERRLRAVSNALSILVLDLHHLQGLILLTCSILIHQGIFMPSWIATQSLTPFVNTCLKN